MTRFSKTDWLDLGLKLLAQEGPVAIRIDGLCGAADRTKGSFYHHFKDREDFVSTLLAHWEQTLTQNVIDEADRETDPVARLIALNKITIETDMGVERALRRWAGSDAQVETAIRRVDKRRVEYVASLLQQAKNITSQQAIDLAVMNYAYLVGFQQIYTPVTPERRARIDRMYVQILEGLPNHD